MKSFQNDRLFNIFLYKIDFTQNTQNSDLQKNSYHFHSWQDWFSNFDFLYSFYELWMVSPDVNSIKGQLTLPLINCFLQKQCVILHLSYIWNFQKFHKDCTYFLSYLIKNIDYDFTKYFFHISYVCQTQCVEISGFFCHSDFTWNQLSKIISSKTAVLDIFGALNFIQLVNLSL